MWMTKFHSHTKYQQYINHIHGCEMTKHDLHNFSLVSRQPDEGSCEKSRNMLQYNLTTYKEQLWLTATILIFDYPTSWTVRGSYSACRADDWAKSTKQFYRTLCGKFR
jgi:hypothetical protein